MVDPDQRRLRRTDLWTGFGLMVFAIAILGVTLTFPITDSYGGVRNVWYVSPALLPLMLGIAILLMACMLVHNAVRQLGIEGAREALRLPTMHVSPSGLRLWIILGSICVYVYILVPRVDFAVATALFLMVFVYAFRLDREASVLRNLIIVVAGGAAVMLASALAPVDHHDLMVDGVALAALFIAALTNRSALRRQNMSLRPWRQGLWLSLIAPLILSVLFRYGLLVPMPHEGTILRAIDTARYALLH